MNGKPVVASLLENPLEKGFFKTFPKTFMVIYDELITYVFQAKESITEKFLIGVGRKSPALQTVRAVFPHTAIPPVFSSSGLARQLPGFFHGEKPKTSEEFIWPAFVIFKASPGSTILLVLLPENGTHSSSYERV